MWAVFGDWKFNLYSVILVVEMFPMDYFVQCYIKNIWHLMISLNHKCFKCIPPINVLVFIHQSRWKPCICVQWYRRESHNVKFTISDNLNFVVLAPNGINTLQFQLGMLCVGVMVNSTSTGFAILLSSKATTSPLQCMVFISQQQIFYKIYMMNSKSVCKMTPWFREQRVNSLWPYDYIEYGQHWNR